MLVRCYDPILRSQESTSLVQIKSYYGVSHNLLIKFSDDKIDETSTLAQVLSSESAISSVMDVSVQTLPGDHGFPLQQASCIFKCLLCNSMIS